MSGMAAAVRRWWYRSRLHSWWDIREDKLWDNNWRIRCGIRWCRITSALWRRWYWRAWLTPTWLELEERRVTALAHSLRQQWLILVHQDHENDVDYDDENGARHRAYLAYEAECTRWSDVAIPDAPHAWLGSDGSLSHCDTWAGLMSGYGYDPSREAPKVRPVSRRQAYRAMGWKYEPPPTAEEVEHWRKMSAAMSRIDSRQWTEEHGNLSVMHLGKPYFDELVANLREDEAAGGAA